MEEKIGEGDGDGIYFPLVTREKGPMHEDDTFSLVWRGREECSWIASQVMFMHFPLERKNQDTPIGLNFLWLTGQ